MNPDLVVRLLIIVGLATVILTAAVVRRRTRTTWRPRRRRLDPDDLPTPLTEPLTLVSFAGRLCSDCQEVPHVATAGVPEVPLVQVSVTDRPGLVARYGIKEIPSLVLVDRQGHIHYAHQGLPSAEALWRAMRPLWDAAWAGRPRTRGTTGTSADSRFTDLHPETARPTDPDTTL